jgi:phospholipid/cholesterol/gamma-HCH transport system substrate-binding protein
MKNRQLNFPPLGFNFFVGAQARPNELTYSEDWMRPDYVPAGPPGPPVSQVPGLPLAAEAQPPIEPPPAMISTDPSAGLPGMMVPAGGG